MSDTIDVTAMYAMHDALRRELEHIARITARVDGDPQTILRTAVGWQLAFATPQQWTHFGQVHGQRIGPDAPRLIPWLLDGASERTVTTILALLPEPARAAYAAQWQPAYAALDRWRADIAH